MVCSQWWEQPPFCFSQLFTISISIPGEIPHTNTGARDVGEDQDDSKGPGHTGGPAEILTLSCMIELFGPGVHISQGAL